MHPYGKSPPSPWTFSAVRNSTFARLAASWHTFVSLTGFRHDKPIWENLKCWPPFPKIYLIPMINFQTRLNKLISCKPKFTIMVLTPSFTHLSFKRFRTIAFNFFISGWIVQFSTNTIIFTWLVRTSLAWISLFKVELIFSQWLLPKLWYRLFKNPPYSPVRLYEERQPEPQPVISWASTWEHA